MNFISTRNLKEVKTSAEAIIMGLSETGGLYVPEKFPDLKERLDSLKELSYEDLAFQIIKEFFSDLGEDTIRECVDNAYKNKFEVRVKNNFLELYHGPTSAFKDAALLFLPQIMKKAKDMSRVKEEIVILTATSGDTGKAALEGFKDIEGLKVIVFYPKDGVSKVQEYQMLTQVGDNVDVVSIDGNFDDAQSGVKVIFSDDEFKETLKKQGILFSSANSINIARLVPQIVYYFYGYFNFVKENKVKMGDKINVVVPTGNFGNILAAYYSKQMGLPLDKFVCASNENNVLTDFINTKIYDKNRELILTESPSMDILVSSNLERLLFEISNRNDKVVETLMNSLSNQGIYEISEEMKGNMNDFYAYSADKDRVYNEIKNVFESDNYLMDTHTAVAYSAYKQYVEATSDEKPVLIASTASPYKFIKSITEAIELEYSGDLTDFELLNLLNEKTRIEIPRGLKDLDKRPILHDLTCNKEDMKAIINKIVGSK
ncbi:MAG: threonine synthase [Sarcina sp.]